MVVIKYLITNQHDDSYTTLDKTRHLLVGHYVRNDVQSLNVTFYIKMQVQILLSLQQISSFELDTKMTIVFFNYIYNYLVITIIK